MFYAELRSQIVLLKTVVVEELYDHCYDLRATERAAECRGWEKLLCLGSKAEETSTSTHDPVFWGTSHSRTPFISRKCYGKCKLAVSTIRQYSVSFEMG